MPRNPTRHPEEAMLLRSLLVLASTVTLAVPLAAQEKSVRTDRPTLAFRKIYFERLKGSSAAKPAD